MGRAQTDARPNEILPSFDGMSDRDRELLLSKGQKGTYNRGELIPLPGEESVVAIVRGEVRLYLPGPQGKELEEARLREGDIFLLGAGSGDEDEHIQAKAMAKDTTLLWVPFQHFVRDEQVRSTVYWLSKIQTRRYRDTQNCLRERAFFRLRERLAHKLAKIALKSRAISTTGEGEAVVNETRESLSMMIGTRAEEVSRAVRYLEMEGLVHCAAARRAIKLLDVEALKNYGIVGRTPPEKAPNPGRSAFGDEERTA